MSKKIEDYLHLYPGCDGLCNQNYGGLRPNIKQVKAKFLYVNHNNEACVQCFDTYGKPWDSLVMVHPRDFIPAFRPISDMTEEECLECSKVGEVGIYLSNEGAANAIRTLFSHNGFYYKQTNLSGSQWGKIINYCRSKSFDMDYLIPEGLAIDSTTLK